MRGVFWNAIGKMKCPICNKKGKKVNDLTIIDKSAGFIIHKKCRAKITEEFLIKLMRKAGCKGWEINGVVV